MSQHTLNLVKALDSKDQKTAQASFLASISEKVKQALDVRRIQIASKIFPAK
jgi:hypothetical protein